MMKSGVTDYRDVILPLLKAVASAAIRFRSKGDSDSAEDLNRAIDALPDALFEELNYEEEDEEEEDEE